jgi:hypothetical protein
LANLWENSAARNKALNIQRQINRIMAGDKSRVSCAKSFCKFTIFPLTNIDYATNTYYAITYGGKHGKEIQMYTI